jgi:hypothetical protein
MIVELRERLDHEERTTRLQVATKCQNKKTMMFMEQQGLVLRKMLQEIAEAGEECVRKDFGCETPMTGAN